MKEAICWDVVAIVKNLTFVVTVLVFEVYVVPLLEILPEENIAFVIIALLSLFFIYKTWTRSKLNKVNHSDSRDDLYGNRNKATETVCSVCRKRVPPRTYHCSICQTCILCKEHHCLWLDCCVGEKNQWHFVLALFFSFCALFDGAYLTLTSVCHPIFVLEYMLVPDDCSDVYHDFTIALCFISALYSLLVAILVLFLLGQHCWLISLGYTKQDWLELPTGERRCGGLWASRPYNKGFIRNWINFWCSRSSTSCIEG
ncbi:Palmitoyltransferase [Gryllus bimaculatus]|nr:Palmitoyltransferase [Gryllus bimaculatus]